jgi:hypothetical protein
MMIENLRMLPLQSSSWCQEKDLHMLVATKNCLSVTRLLTISLGWILKRTFSTSATRQQSTCFTQNNVSSARRNYP